MACEGTRHVRAHGVWAQQCSGPAGLVVGLWPSQMDSEWGSVPPASLSLAARDRQGSQDITAYPVQEERRTEHLRAAPSTVCAELWAVLHSLTGTSPTPSSGRLLQMFCPTDHSPVVFKMFSFCCLNVFMCSHKALKCKVLCPKKHLWFCWVFFCGTSNPFNFGSLQSTEPGFSLCGP